MNAPADWNELDCALAAFVRSRSAMPELFRQLVHAETLHSLLPYHPEVVDGQMELRNGVAFPFIRLEEEGEEVVPIFTSLERVEESLARARVPENTYVSASMPARQMLEVIGVMDFPAVLNKSCGTGSFTMPPDLLRDLVSGAVFRPPANSGPAEECRLNIIDPADYPTDLVQPLFEILRLHRNFRAAWIFRSPEPPLQPGLTRYQLLVLMDPRNEKIFHDLNIVSQNACYETAEVHLSFLPEDDPDYVRSFIDQVPPPFYAAPDFATKPVI